MSECNCWRGESWSHFPHQADVGVEGHGRTLAQAFEQAALALTAAVTTEKIADEVAIEVTCEARDRELLLVEWLNAIIYEMATRNMLFSRFQVEIDGNRLRGTLWGEPVDPPRHQPATEPKGATFTELSVSRDEHGMWSARCVVDV
jgi:protein archease